MKLVCKQGLFMAGLALVLSQSVNAGSYWLPEKSFCKIEGERNEIEKVQLSPSGRLLAVLTREGKGYLWSIDGTFKKVLPMPRVSDLAFFPDDRRVATVQLVDRKVVDGNDSFTEWVHQALVWNIDNRKKLAASPKNNGEETIDHIDVTPDGKTIIMSAFWPGYEKLGYDENHLSSFGLFDENLKFKKAIKRHYLDNSFSISPDGSMILSRELDMGGDVLSHVYVYSIASGHRMMHVSPSKNSEVGIEVGIDDAKFAPDSKSFMVAIGNNLLWYRLDSQAVRRFHLKGLTGNIEALAFSPDGQRIAVKQGRQLFLRDLNQKKSKKLNLRSEKKGGGFTFTPDGNKLLIGCELYDVSPKSLYLQASR